jgi:hypothetical protein
MFNKALLTPRNIAIIGIISVVSHIVAGPLYRAVAKKGSN